MKNDSLLFSFFYCVSNCIRLCIKSSAPSLYSFSAESCSPNGTTSRRFRRRIPLTRPSTRRLSALTPPNELGNWRASGASSSSNKWRDYASSETPPEPVSASFLPPTAAVAAVPLTTTPPTTTTTILANLRRIEAKEEEKMRRMK